MSEVKSQPVRLNERSRLMDVIAQNAAESRVQKVGRAVGAHYCGAAGFIVSRLYLIADLEVAGLDYAVVQVLAALILLNVGNLKNGLAAGNSSVVGDLAAHLGIHNRSVEDENRGSSGNNLLLKLSL